MLIDCTLWGGKQQKTLVNKSLNAITGGAIVMNIKTDNIDIEFYEVQGNNYEEFHKHRFLKKYSNSGKVKISAFLDIIDKVSPDGSNQNSIYYLKPKNSVKDKNIKCEILGVIKQPSSAQFSGFMVAFSFGIKEKGIFGGSKKVKKVISIWVPKKEQLVSLIYLFARGEDEKLKTHIYDKNGPGGWLII